MKPRNLRSLLAALAAIAGLGLAAEAAAQPCSCSNATLIGTQANVHYAAFLAGTDWNGTVTTAVEMPAASNMLQWNIPQRFVVDIQASKLRIEFARDATYGQGSPIGSQFKFALHPTAAAPCGAAKVVGSTVTTNRSDAAAYVASQSSFGTPAVNDVTVVFGNSGSQPFADWRKGDWIEAQLKFDCLTAQMPPHNVGVVTAGPVNACANYKLCFDVNVPNNAVANGAAALSLQLYQNGAPVGVPLTHTMTADGLWCFQMPAIALGQGFDYVLTTVYSFPGTANQTQVIGPFGVAGQQQGPNNDLVCAGTPASTCCPPVNHEMVAGMFDDNASNNGAAYVESLQAGSPAALSFVNGLNAYLSYLKFICPQITNLKAEFFTGPVTAPTTPGSPAGPLALTTPVATYTTGGNLAVALAPLSNLSRNQGQYYRTSVKITGINAAGAAVNCGFDAKACALDDTYAFMHNSTAKMAPGFPPRTQ